MNAIHKGLNGRNRGEQNAERKSLSFNYTVTDIKTGLGIRIIILVDKVGAVFHAILIYIYFCSFICSVP
jgi:hypothetical protein